MTNAVRVASIYARFSGDNTPTLEEIFPYFLLAEQYGGAVATAMIIQNGTYGNTLFSDDLTTQQKVTAVFQELFGRDPLQAGLDYWVDQLENNSAYVNATSLAQAILRGAEAQTEILDGDTADWDFVQSYASQYITELVNYLLDDEDNTNSEENDKSEDRYNLDYTGDEDTKIGTSGFSVLTAESTDLIRLNDFRSDVAFFGLNGDGYSVVVLDTGIDLDHSFFGDDLNHDGISDRIIYTYDFTNDGDGTVDDINGHGTNVASIIASSDETYTGIAPEANIIALQVLANDGSGSFAWLERALQWVVNNADAYNITAINMSLGDGANSNYVSSAYGLGDEFAALNSLGVINVAAAGNDYYTYQSEGASNPSVDPNVISVGAVWDSDIGEMKFSDGSEQQTGEDKIAVFSQRSDTVVDIFAPGGYITGAAPGGEVASMSGTSQAAPHITGVAILAQELAIQELGRRLTQDEFVDLMNQSGVAIYDGDDEDDNVINSENTYKRIDMEALAQAILEYDAESVNTDEEIIIVEEDNISNNTSTNAFLNIDSTTSSSIDFNGDKDWFRVNLQSNHEYEFNLIGNSLSDPYLRLHAANGEYITYDDDSGNGLNSSIIFIAPTTGTYYLSAEAYSNELGSYTLEATDLGSNDSDDYGQTINNSGNINVNGSISGNLEQAYDNDWFSVYLNESHFYTIDLEGLTLLDPLVELYDPNGNYITFNDDGGDGYDSQLLFEATESGTYYINAKAYSYGTGTYWLSIEEATINDDYGSNIYNHGSISMDSSINGNIEVAYDEDWFVVQLTAGNIYTIDLVGNTLGDTYLELYDANSNYITFNDDGGNGLNSHLRFDAASSGTYYLNAKAYSNGIGTYSLTVEETHSNNEEDLINIYDTVLNSDYNVHEVSLIAGETYDIDLFGVSMNSDMTLIISNEYLNLFEPENYTQEDLGNFAYDDDSGEGYDSYLSFTPMYNDEYFIYVGDYNGVQADYHLVVEIA